MKSMDCFVLLITFFVCQTDGDPDMVRLYRSLLKGYVKDIRPAINHSAILNITIGFSLTQIIDVDEKNQILTTNAWINQQWFDYRLRWRSSYFGNISTAHVPHDKIWRPDVVLYNNANSRYNTAIMSTDVFVSSYGNVTWLSAAIFRSSCEMNVRYYPFDEQVCTMKFASWAYDGTLIDLNLISQKGDISNYMASTEWDLVFIGVKQNYVYYSCCEEPFPDVIVTIRIRRRPMFYLFNLILPCILITGVALLGFYMPSDSGEKVTLGITTLLSMTVFLMLVAESMPPNADTLPLIGMYYGVTICLVSLATAMTVFTLNIHHKGLRGHPVPKLVKTVAFGVVAKLVRIKLDPPDSWDVNDQEQGLKSGERQPLTANNVANRTTSLINGGVLIGSMPRFPYTSPSMRPSRKDDFEAQFLRVMSKVYATIERNERRLADDDRRDVIKLEWQQVALVADRFLLLAFIVITTGSSLLIIYQRHLSIG